MRWAPSWRATTWRPEDRFHLHFALGKALEDAGRYEESFEHYRQGNALRRKGLDYDADEMAANVARAKALYTPRFFAERQGMGDPRPDPIFVVGLPRSGSTLVEQILASHSPGRGHPGAARHHRHRQAPRRPASARATPTPIPRRWPALGRTS